MAWEVETTFKREEAQKSVGAEKPQVRLVSQVMRMWESAKGAGFGKVLRTWPGKEQEQEEKLASFRLRLVRSGELGAGERGKSSEDTGSVLGGRRALRAQTSQSGAGECGKVRRELVLGKPCGLGQGKSRRGRTNLLLSGWDWSGPENWVQESVGRVARSELGKFEEGQVLLSSFSRFF
ncbi:hypothetical protein RTBOTA2_002593 [Rhodotorula toruloides]|nr:hypothetical protein RTBOTA2_002593 [Rhodotorula toruloides]